MSNAQHSVSTGEWYTPKNWIEAVRRALGRIDLDPCSSAKANTVVRAGAWWGPGNGVDCSWRDCGHATAFVNPPGSCVVVDGLFSICGNPKKCSCKLPRQFLARSLIEAYKGMEIIYLACSINQLRMLVSLKWPPGVLVSVAVPASRIPYLNPETLEPVQGTNCDSAFFCLARSTHTHAQFKEVFQLEGCRVFTA